MAARDPKTGRFPKGQGPGWGGPAKGRSASRIKPGDPDGIQPMSHDPRLLAKAEERTGILKDHLFGLALAAEREETQLAATVAFLNREEGMPIARHLNANVADPAQLTDAQLLAIATSGGPPPDPPKDDPPKPGGVVH